MGKLARFACILTPMLCTLASLICTILVIVGGTNKSNAWISDIYFLRLDARNIKFKSTWANIPSTGTSVDSKITNIESTGLSNQTANDLGLANFYSAHLWNHCSGTISSDNNTWTVTDCDKPTASFSFNIFTIFNDDAKEAGKSQINETSLPEAVTKVNQAIKVVSNVIVALFVCAVIANGVTFFVGWFGLLSRWGSCVTTIFADLAFFFLLSACSVATALYATLKEGFNRALNDFGASATLNNRTLSIMWVGVIFAFAASLFWMFSTCCCSGRSKKIMNNKKHENPPYTYEKVAAPYAPTTTVGGSGPQQGVGYEPYRHAGAQ